MQSNEWSKSYFSYFVHLLGTEMIGKQV